MGLLYELTVISMAFYLNVPSGVRSLFVETISSLTCGDGLRFLFKSMLGEFPG